MKNVRLLVEIYIRKRYGGLVTANNTPFITGVATGAVIMLNSTRIIAV